MDLELAKEIFETAYKIENERWEAPSKLEGKVIAFEEWLLKRFPEDSEFGTPIVGKLFLPDGEYKGAQIYMRMAKFMLGLFKDDPAFFYNLAYSCGSCCRIVIGQPRLVEDAWKIINGGWPEYACRSCGSLLYTISPKNGINPSRRGTLSSHLSEA